MEYETKQTDTETIGVGDVADDNSFLLLPACEVL